MPCWLSHLQLSQSVNPHRRPALDSLLVLFFPLCGFRGHDAGTISDGGMGHLYRVIFKSGACDCNSRQLETRGVTDVKPTLVADTWHQTK